MATTVAYKAFTHDLRSPVMGGLRVWDGILPYTLPAVEVDLSSEVCAKGWHATERMADALFFAGCLRGTRAVRLFRVETEEPIERRVFEYEGVGHSKSRAATWTITDEVPVTEDVLDDALRGMPDVAKAAVAAEQARWFAALSGDRRDASEVEAALWRFIQTSGMPFPGLRRREARLAEWDDRAASLFGGSRLGRAGRAAQTWVPGPSRRDRSRLRHLIGEPCNSNVAEWLAAAARKRTALLIAEPLWVPDVYPVLFQARPWLFAAIPRAVRHHLTVLLAQAFGFRPPVPDPLTGIEDLQAACSAGLGGISVGDGDVLEWWLEEPFRHSYRRAAIRPAVQAAGPNRGLGPDAPLTSGRYSFPKEVFAA